jgi:hypothetical protein
MLGAVHDEREPAPGRAFSEWRVDALLKSVICYPPQERILVLAVEKNPRNKCAQFLGLIDSVVVAVRADNTR